MQTDIQQRIFEEIKGFMANKTTGLAEAELPFPANVYFDPDHMDREKRLMEKYPIIVGHSSQLKEPGDFLSHDLLGIPIMVVRQKNGSVLAFLNICSHRGARLCTENTGNSSRFVCPYHAWTYSLDGRLRGVPKSGFPNYDISKGNLTPLQVEERHGLVWVQVDPTTPINVTAHLGEIDDEIASYGISDCEVHSIKVLDADINWKSVLDGFFGTLSFCDFTCGFHCSLFPRHTFTV
eukprot:GHVU01183568.1.p1 GENE.GHVU01183568.1~~GHVU01183568.1.p1  ORF type:complete len:236 (+),score=8.72 GHVU01183568.1:521-1228(+)